MPASEDWDLGFSNVVYVKTKASNDPTPGETVFVTPIVTAHNGDYLGEVNNTYSPSNYTHYEGTNSVTINLQPTSPSIVSRTPPLPVQRTRRPIPLLPTRSISHREPHEINPPSYSTYRIIKPSFSWNTTTSIPTARSNSLPPLLSASPRPSFSSTDQLPSSFGTRLRQPRRSVVSGSTCGGIPPPPSFSRRYSCDYGKLSYMPTNISPSSNVIHDVKVPSTYYSGNVSTLRRPSFSKPVGLENGDVSFSRRPSLSRMPHVEHGDILTLRRPSFSRPATTGSYTPSLQRRASVEPRPQTSLGHSTAVRGRYLSESDSTNEKQSRPTAESYASLKNRTDQVKDKIKYHQQLMDRYLPVSNGPVGDVRYDVEYKFVELADRMPEFEAYRSPSRRGSASSMRSAVPSRASSRERSPYIPQTPTGAPKVSEARQKIRQVLRSTSANNRYCF